MEAVKLESMHAPEHAMSSLVVAQVRILVSAIATLQAGCQVARWPTFICLFFAGGTGGAKYS